MLVRGMWCAVRHTVSVRNRKTGETFEQHTMEFTRFVEDTCSAGVRTVESWTLSDQPLNERP